MSHHAEKVGYNKLKNNSSSPQIDESTDFSNKYQAIAFVRFVNDTEIQENFFCCNKLHEQEARTRCT